VIYTRIRVSHYLRNEVKCSNSRCTVEKIIGQTVSETEMYKVGVFRGKVFEFPKCDTKGLKIYVIILSLSQPLFYKWKES
jgi:hypothetical protein